MKKKISGLLAAFFLFSFMTSALPVSALAETIVDAESTIEEQGLDAVQQDSLAVNEQSQPVQPDENVINVASDPVITVAGPNYKSPGSSGSPTIIKLTANNVVDWLHFCNKDASFTSTKPNKKKDVAGDRLTFEDYPANSTYPSLNEDWYNHSISYTDGTNPVSATASPKLNLFSKALNAGGKFTAPSKNGVKRSLVVYMGSYAGKEIEVTAKMGEYTVPGITNFTTGEKTTKLADYTFEYTGTEEELPLEVSFKLTDNTLDATWAGIGFSAACILEGEYVPQSRIEFTSPELKGEYAVKAPPSGRVRRDLPADLYDAEDVLVENPELVYTLETPAKGVSLDGNIISVTNELEESKTITIKVKDKANTVSATREVELVKDTNLKDFSANPLEKAEYKLFHSSEFDNGPDPRYWSDYYLRSWGKDEESKSHYFVEDGSLVLNAPRNIAKAWSTQDRNHRVSGIMSFEKQHLHRFGNASESREIPVFDGVATKYGYFEVRMKLPNTRDGSHFAWWMVGTQDDQHPSVELENNMGNSYYDGKYPGENMSWTLAKYFWSNQGAEYDIVEQQLDPTKAGSTAYGTYRPVLHKNGTRHYYTRWYSGELPSAQQYKYAEKGIDPYNEYHIYGFEWDDSGTKMYIDNELVYTSHVSAGYRMMTIFSLYAGRSIQENGDMGWDRGIYPKDAYIDYFRVYKKDEPAKATSVVLNNYNTPYYFEIPASGSKQIPMSAVVLDQFDKEFQLEEGQELKWCFTKDIGGMGGSVNSAADTGKDDEKDISIFAGDIVNPEGVSINEDTGVVTIQSDAKLKQDLFLTAYVTNTKVKRKVYETRHVKLSKEAPKPSLVAFDKQYGDTVEAGTTIDLSAKLYDQYMQPIDTTFTYNISKDITARETMEIPGVSISAEGKLTIASTVPSGTNIVVTADSGKTHVLNGTYLQNTDKIMQNKVIQVEGTIDKSGLLAVYEKCKNLVESKYTPGSWENLKEIMTAAKTVLDDEGATQQDIDTAKLALEGAFDGLVLRKLVESITIAPETLQLKIGESSSLDIKVIPADAFETGYGIVSSNPQVASVTSDGKVTAVKEGTAVITATTTEGEKTAKCSVTVVKKAVSEPGENKNVEATGITLDKNTLSLDKGATAGLTATVAPANATDKSVTWLSSNSKVASVDANGKVEGISGGTASITATTKNGKFKAVCNVEVLEKINQIRILPKGYTVDGSGITLAKKGRSATLRVDISPKNASNKNISWKSSAPKVISVTSGGKVIAKAAKGKAVITAFANDGSGKKASITVTIGRCVTKVKLNKTRATLKKGKSIALKASVQPANATNKKVLWFSSNPDVAKVSKNGKVTAIKPGKATITAISADGNRKKANFKLIVKK